VEFPVDDGEIDILATDRQQRFVVFELKLAGGCNKVLGQLLYHMGWVDKHLGNGPCRGIIVAKEISDDLISAAQRVKGVSLYQTQFLCGTSLLKLRDPVPISGKYNCTDFPNFHITIFPFEDFPP